jgi:anti-sigma factor RsiW
MDRHTYTTGANGSSESLGLSCRQLVELVTEYFGGTLHPVDRVRFETHIDDCPGCTTYVEQMRETIRLTGRLAEDEVDAAARDALLAAFRGWKHRAHQ